MAICREGCSVAVILWVGADHSRNRLDLRPLVDEAEMIANMSLSGLRSEALVMVKVSRPSQTKYWSSSSFES